MQRLPRDVLIKLSLELEMPELINLCQSSKKYNEMLCKNPVFWRQKIEKKRPGFLEVFNAALTEKERDNMDYRKLYFELDNPERTFGFNLALNHKLDGPEKIVGLIYGEFGDYASALLNIESYRKVTLGSEVFVIANLNIYQPEFLIEQSKEDLYFFLEGAVEYVKRAQEFSETKDDLVEKEDDNFIVDRLMKNSMYHFRDGSEIVVRKVKVV